MNIIMYIACWISICCSTIVLSGCGTVENRPLISDTDHISPAQLSSLKKSAENGNAAAAYRLSNYYAFFVDDMALADMWLKKAADLKHHSAEVEWAVKLIESNDLVMKEQGMALLRDSAQNGNRRASKLLKLHENNSEIRIPIKNSKRISGRR